MIAAALLTAMLVTAPADCAGIEVYLPETTSSAETPEQADGGYWSGAVVPQGLACGTGIDPETFAIEIDGEWIRHSSAIALPAGWADPDYSETRYAAPSSAGILGMRRGILAEWPANASAETGMELDDGTELLVDLSLEARDRTDGIEQTRWVPAQTTDGQTGWVETRYLVEAPIPTDDVPAPETPDPAEPDPADTPRPADDEPDTEPAPVEEPDDEPRDGTGMLALIGGGILALLAAGFAWTTRKRRAPEQRDEIEEED